METSSKSPRSVIHRTMGERHGPLTRLISPDGLGQKLKPFVLLDLFQKDGDRTEFGLHPHSGIATLTYVAEGAANYVDPNGERGVLSDGSLEWMKAGRGMWHAGGSEAGALIGIQLWLALPPEHELSPYQASYIPADKIQVDGPARALLGTSGNAKSQIDIDLPVQYLAVSLTAGESWNFVPPDDHDLLWLAVAKGSLERPEARTGELIVFDTGADPLEVVAAEDATFVVGSGRSHPHDLVMGRYSIHTNEDALATGERQIKEIAVELRSQGRL